MLNFMREDTFRIFCFWLISWYILESVILILSYILNWGVLFPLGDEEFPSILAKIIVIFMVSLSWPLYMSFLTGLFIIGFEGSSISYLFQPKYWSLYITTFVAFIFTLITWKNDKIWRIKKNYT